MRLDQPNQVVRLIASTVDRAKSNAQAALLIRLVQKYPDTVQRLAAV